MAEAVIGSFLDRLVAEVAQRSGSLNVDDIRASDGEFKNKTETFRRFSNPR